MAKKKEILIAYGLLRNKTSTYLRKSGFKFNKDFCENADKDIHAVNWLYNAHLLTKKRRDAIILRINTRIIKHVHEHN